MPPAFPLACQVLKRYRNFTKNRHKQGLRSERTALIDNVIGYSKIETMAANHFGLLKKISDYYYGKGGKRFYENYIDLKRLERQNNRIIYQVKLMN